MRTVNFHNFEEAEIYTKIPAEWLSPLALSAKVAWEAMKDFTGGEEIKKLSNEEKEQAFKVRGYYFSLWTRLDMMAYNFEIQQERAKMEKDHEGTE